MRHLKKIRIDKDLTQTAVAKSVGVTQPTYQRWESGAVDVPKDKLLKLSKVLTVTVDEILGGGRPFDMLGIDHSVADNRTYFGEVSIRFKSGQVLLVPVSEAERINLFSQAESQSSDFYYIDTLDNRIIFCNKHSIEDIHISDEAYDDYGPDGQTDDYIGVFPDEDFWDFIKAYFADDKEGLDEFSAQRSKEFTEEIEAYNQEYLEKLNDRASRVEWCLSSGVIRRHAIFDEAKLFLDVSGLEGSYLSDEPIKLSIEEDYLDALIFRSSLEYLSVPSHLYNEGARKTFEEDLDC